MKAYKNSSGIWVLVSPNGDKSWVINNIQNGKAVFRRCHFGYLGDVAELQDYDKSGFPFADSIKVTTLGKTVFYNFAVMEGYLITVD